MVLLEQNAMAQMGLNINTTTLQFSLTPTLENIKQEISQTSPVSDKENLQQTTNNNLPDSTTTNSSNKKKAGLYSSNSTSTTSSGGGVTKPRTGRRNARERNRVRYLNMTFEHLRQHLPQKTNNKGKAKKMSKVDTLRSAIDYIRGLQELLDDNDAVNAVFGNGTLTTALTTALSEVEDTPSPGGQSSSAGGYSPDGSPCSSSAGTSPPGGYGAPIVMTPGSGGTAVHSATEYSMSTSADSALFSEEDGDDFIDITSWLQC